jgi:hypothetical protein
MIPLHLPKNSKHNSAKLKAYKRHWASVRSIQDEFSRQYIHENLNIKRVVERSQVGRQTVKRFMQFGRSTGKLGYSYFHGPTVTTIFGIADALGLNLKLEKKNGRAK